MSSLSQMVKNVFPRSPKSQISHGGDGHLKKGLLDDVELIEVLSQPTKQLINK